jgi:HEAT repeat protein
VVEAGAVPPLIQLLYSPHEKVLEQAAWALGNIAGENPACRDILLASGALHILSRVEVVSSHSLPASSPHTLLPVESIYDETSILGS